MRSNTSSPSGFKWMATLWWRMWSKPISLRQTILSQQFPLTTIPIIPSCSMSALWRQEREKPGSDGDVGDGHGMTCSAENSGQLSHPSKDSYSFCIRLDRSLGPSEQSGDTDRIASSRDCGRSYGMGRVTSRPFADPFSLLVPLGDCGGVPLYSNLVAASLGLCSGRF